MAQWVDRNLQNDLWSVPYETSGQGIPMCAKRNRFNCKGKKNTDWAVRGLPYIRSLLAHSFNLGLLTKNNHALSTRALLFSHRSTRWLLPKLWGRECRLDLVFFVDKKQEILLNCGMGQKINSKSCLLPKKLTSAATASQQFCVQDWVTS